MAKPDVKNVTKKSVSNGRTAAEDAPSSVFVEIGTSGLKRFSGEVQEEFDPNLRGLRGVRVYEEMRKNDSDVGSILFAILHIALGSTWTVEAASQNQPDLDAAEFLRTVLFKDTSHSWRDFITNAMTSNAFGWAWFEIVYKQRLGAAESPPSLYDDGRIGIRKLALRGQETLRGWIFDEHDGVQGMIQRGPNQTKEVRIPIAKSLLCRTSSEKNNPEGVSMLRTAYRAYFIKTNVEEIEVIGAERDMTGVLVIQLPGNAQDKDFAKARDMGERYRIDDQAYFITQKFGKEEHEGWKITTLQSPGNKIVDTDKTITRCSTQIMRSVLAQFLTLGQGRTGSFALGESQKSLWQLATNGRLDTLDEEVNRYVVPPLFALNDFSEITGYPQVKHSDPGEIDLIALTPFIRVLGEMGYIDLTQEVLEHMHARAGLPPPDPDAAEKILEKAKERENDPGDPENLPKNPERQHQTNA